MIRGRSATFAEGMCSSQGWQTTMSPALPVSSTTLTGAPSMSKSLTMNRAISSWPCRSVRSLFVGIDRTPVAALTGRARKLWECLAGAPAGFTPGMSVVVSPRSYLCPPGWAGIVVLGGAALATAPDHKTARVVEQALSGLPASALTDTEVLGSRLPVAEIRGPAALAYLDSAEFRPPPGDAVTTPLGLDHPGFRQFLLAADTDDVEEAGLRRSPPRPSPSASTARSLPQRATGTGPAAQRT